jgi:hypothetical protein
MYICILLYMFRLVTPLIIRSSYHCTCIIWHYWDRTDTCLERVWQGTGLGVNLNQFQARHVPDSRTVWIMPNIADTVIWAPDDEWSCHSKHVEQFTNINKLYIVAYCWYKPLLLLTINWNFCVLNERWLKCEVWSSCSGDDEVFWRLSTCSLVWEWA